MPTFPLPTEAVPACVPIYVLYPPAVPAFVPKDTPFVIFEFIDVMVKAPNVGFVNVLIV